MNVVTFMVIAKIMTFLQLEVHSGQLFQQQLHSRATGVSNNSMPMLHQLNCIRTSQDWYPGSVGAKAHQVILMDKQD